MNKNRFVEEFSGDTIRMPEKNPRPPDYQALFSGNTDDNFKIGLSVTKKCLKVQSIFRNFWYEYGIRQNEEREDSTLCVP